MSRSDFERRSGIAGTAWAGVNLMGSEGEAHVPVGHHHKPPRDRLLHCLPDLSSFHFLGLDENKARKEKWFIFHLPVRE